MSQQAIYLIRAANGLHKIGVSSFPFARFRDLRIASPVALSLIHVSWPYDAAKVERVLHERFQAKCHHGEWFSLAKKDVKQITSEYPAGESIEEQGKSPFDKFVERVRRKALLSRKTFFIFKDPFDETGSFRCALTTTKIPRAHRLATVTCAGGVHFNRPRQRSDHAAHAE